MSLEVLSRLEKLVDQLLVERSDLQQRCMALSKENEKLVNDRKRVSDELDKLLNKLEKLEGQDK